MTCPFNKESLEKLEAFVAMCRSKPEVLHLPQLRFFKDYLQSLDAALPPEPATPEAPPTQQHPDPPTPAEERDMDEGGESEAESELEFDMEGCIAPDAVGEEQAMGDASKVPSEEESDQADQKRSEAQAQLGEGNLERAVELFTEAIQLNPTLAVLFVKRGQCYLKLKRPNACIKDCTHALALNPDSAPGYKFRGRAYRLIADWENSARDLRQACKIDFDEQADEWLKEVTPNAQKIEQHRLKLERKQAEREQKERAERARKAREAHEKAAKVEAETEAEGGTPFGGMGGAGMGDFYKLLQDPEIMAGLQDPEIAQAFQDISTNPANFMKYQNNPKVMALFQKFTKLGGLGGMNMGGGGGGFGGFGKPTATPPEDDGLD